MIIMARRHSKVLHCPLLRHIVSCKLGLDGPPFSGHYQRNCDSSLGAKVFAVSSPSLHSCSLSSYLLSSFISLSTRAKKTVTSTVCKQEEVDRIRMEMKRNSKFFPSTHTPPPHSPNQPHFDGENFSNCRNFITFLIYGLNSSVPCVQRQSIDLRAPPSTPTTGRTFLGRRRATRPPLTWNSNSSS